MLVLAFLNNGENGLYPSLLNMHPSAFGQVTSQEGASRSIIDYAIASLSSLPRVASFQIHNNTSQDQGSNACGSDHHLLTLLKWRQVITHSPITTPSRYMWNIACLQSSEVQDKYEKSLSLLQTQYDSFVNPLKFTNPNMATLPYALRQSLQDTLAALFNHQVTLALYDSVPANKVTANSKPFWDASLRDLQNRRSAAHAKMRNYEHVLLNDCSDNTVDYLQMLSGLHCMLNM